MQVEVFVMEDETSIAGMETWFATNSTYIIKHVIPFNLNWIIVFYEVP